MSIFAQIPVVPVLHSGLPVLGGGVALETGTMPTAMTLRSISRPENEAVLASQEALLRKSTALVPTGPASRDGFLQPTRVIYDATRGALQSLEGMNAASVKRFASVTRFFGTNAPEGSLGDQWHAALESHDPGKSPAGDDDDSLIAVLSEMETAALDGAEVVEQNLSTLIASPPLTTLAVFENYLLVVRLLLQALPQARIQAMTPKWQQALSGLATLSAETSELPQYIALLHMVLVLASACDEELRLAAAIDLYLRPPHAELGQDGLGLHQSALHALQQGLAPENIFKALAERPGSPGDHVYRITNALERHYAGMDAPVLAAIASNLTLFLTHPEPGARSLARQSVTKALTYLDNDQKPVVIAAMLKQLENPSTRGEIRKLLLKIYPDLSSAVQSDTLVIINHLAADRVDEKRLKDWRTLESEFFALISDKSMAARETFQKLRAQGDDTSIFRGLAFVSRHSDALGFAATEISRFLASELGLAPLRAENLNEVLAEYCAASVFKTFEQSKLFDLSQSEKTRAEIFAQVWPRVVEKMSALPLEEHQRILGVIQNDLLPEENKAGRTYLYAYYVGANSLRRFEEFIYAPDIESYFAEELKSPEALEKRESLRSRIVNPSVHGTITNPNDPRVQEALSRPIADISEMPDWIKTLLSPIPAGEFEMGSNKSDAYDDEKAVHRVVVSAFYMMNVTVTNGLWREVTGEKAPSRYGYHEDDKPVVDVNYHQAVAFAKKLTEKLKKYLGDKYEFRLPTEAEWECAARGPDHKEYATESGNISTSEANYSDTKTGKTMSADDPRYKPNAWGLRQMSGNVWEWVLDYFWDKYYEECQRQGYVVNPRGPANPVGEERHGVRGGSWFNVQREMRASCRYYVQPGVSYSFVGLRLVLASQDS